MTKKQLQAVWIKTITVLFGAPWQAFAIHLSYIGLGLVLFTPLTGFIGQLFLNFSGKPVLSDLDIVYFFLTPPGILTLILFASLFITILVFEQASLMALAAATTEGKHLNFISAVYFTAGRVKKIFLFANQLVIRVLFLTLPFLGFIVAIAWVMLTDYDINYYLAEKPPVFLVAVIFMAICLAGMTVVLIRHLVSWSLALPLFLFSDTKISQSFEKSEELTDGDKKFVLETFTSWALAGIVLSSVVLGCISVAGSFLAPYFNTSVKVLLPAIGGLVSLWLLANLLITTLTSGSFATLLVLFFKRAGKEIPKDLFTENREYTKKKISALMLFTLLAATVGIALFVGDRLAKAIPADTDTMIIAHRGAAGVAPENTMASMRQAIADGTDWLEIDVQESSDGEVVVIHDSDFMKLAGVKLKVWDGTLAEIKKIDVGTWFDAKFAAERVPTLTELLELARGECKVLIELKYYGHDQNLEQRVAEIVEQTDMVDSVAIMSLKYAGVEKFSALRPTWPVGLLSTKAIGKISALDVDFLAINMAAAKPAFIRRIQESGKQVLVWTVNDEVSMSRMISLGVDGLITDEPALTAEVLAENADLSPVERIFIHTAVLLKKPLPKNTYRDKSP